MSDKIKQVWYASYGSNVLKSRFYCYIQGGRPFGSSKTYRGCTDQTLPPRIDSILIQHKLYFAKQDSSWGSGGVAFIEQEKNPEIETLGRMYLITRQQFTELVQQEINHQGKLEIDFQQAIDAGSLLFRKGSWYGNLIYLGKQDGNPIFTFTNESSLLDQINAPNSEYLKTLINGLRETYNLKNTEIRDYLKDIAGIKGILDETQINQLIDSKPF